MIRKKAEIAKLGPYVAQLEEGKSYLWCQCGRSFKQPFCDASHSGSGFGPRRFRARKTGRYALCGCKRTKRPPYCDGSHKEIDVDEQVSS